MCSPVASAPHNRSTMCTVFSLSMRCTRLLGEDAVEQQVARRMTCARVGDFGLPSVATVGVHDKADIEVDSAIIDSGEISRIGAQSAADFQHTLKRAN